VCRLQLADCIKHMCQQLLLQEAGRVLTGNVAQAMGAAPLRAFIASFIVPPGPTQAASCAHIAARAEQARASKVIFPKYSIPMLVLHEQEWLSGFARAACMGVEADSGVAVLRAMASSVRQQQPPKALAMAVPPPAPRFGSTLQLALADAKDRRHLGKPHFRAMAEAVLAAPRVQVPVGELAAVLACMGYDEAAAPPLAACMRFAEHGCGSMEVRPLRVLVGAGAQQALELMAIVLPYTINASCHQYDRDRDDAGQGRLRPPASRRNVMFLPEQATLLDTALCSLKHRQRQFYPFVGEERTTVALLCFNYTSTTEAKCCMTRMVPSSSSGELVRVTTAKDVVSCSPNTPRPAPGGGLAATCDAVQAAMRAVSGGSRGIDGECVQQLLDLFQRACPVVGFQPPECTPGEVEDTCRGVNRCVRTCAGQLEEVLQGLRALL
jgi:hypothetical protein